MATVLIWTKGDVETADRTDRFIDNMNEKSEFNLFFLCPDVTAC